MTTTTKNILLVIGIVLCVSAICAAIFMPLRDDSNAVCHNVRIQISDKAQTPYVQASEIQQLLQSKALYPKDKAAKDINTHHIEQCIAAFNPVKTVQCYKTNNGDVHIRITLRQPLVRVVSETDSYFIDSDRKRMEIRPLMKQEIPVLAGRISEKRAATELTDFILWLQKDKFWSERMGSILVNNKQQVIIRQHNGQPSIVLGQLSDYKRKLKRARTYIENAEAMSLPTYKELDLQYEGQVIGRS